MVLVEKKEDVDDGAPRGGQSVGEGEKGQGNEIHREASRVPEKQSRMDKLKSLFREYGKFFIVYYGTAWCLTLAPIYAAVSASGFDSLELIQRFVDEDSWIYEKAGQLNTNAINFLISVELNEIADVVRLPIVLMTTPRLAKTWKSSRRKT